MWEWIALPTYLDLLIYLAERERNGDSLDHFWGGRIHEHEKKLKRRINTHCAHFILSSAVA